MGDKVGLGITLAATAARVIHLLLKAEQSCLLIVTLKVLPFRSKRQRMFLDMSLWRNILKAD